jgi:outer membrane protein assembly factor BamB
MRRRTLAAVGLLLLAAAGLAVAGLTATPGSDAELTTTWVSETGRETSSNHHAPAAGRVDGQGMVYAPVSGPARTPTCALVGLDGTTGTVRWTNRVSTANCTIHSVADPTLADFDDDGVTEVVAATTERVVVASHPLTGDVEFRHDLASYGYTRPVLADLTPDDGTEVVVVDAQGTVFALRANETTAWSKSLSATTWAQPSVDDFDGDDRPEVAVATGDTAELHVLSGDGSAQWERPRSLDGSITWMTTGEMDDDAAVEIAVATTEGTVAVFDGETGDREWTRGFGAYAAVGATGDGDGDGRPELYAVAKDARLRSLDAETGRTEWATTLTTNDVQMTPPPAMGDVDGDGDAEVVAVTNDGVVSVVDADSGSVVGSYERETRIYTEPRLADVDGDGDAEIFVMYADGRVVAFDPTRT